MGKGFLLALLAALFYAINIPLSALLLGNGEIAPLTMAGLLYIGAGIGIALLSAFRRKGNVPNPLAREDLPGVIGMVLLDIIAPILLMLGLFCGNPANASLLGNFEIVATSLIAAFFFHEKIGKSLWAGIALVTLASMVISFEGGASLRFTPGSLFVLAAATCWGLENNCTRIISSKNAFEIVTIKGLCSGTGALLIAFCHGDSLPSLPAVFCALGLGFVSYGLSITLYVQAQNRLGAARTSACYAINPFIGAALGFALCRLAIPRMEFLAGTLIMLIGSVFVAFDTLCVRHAHPHEHVFTEWQEGVLTTRTIVHCHPHIHWLSSHGPHTHHHPRAFSMKG